MTDIEFIRQLLAWIMLIFILGVVIIMSMMILSDIQQMIISFRFKRGRYK